MNTSGLIASVVLAALSTTPLARADDMRLAPPRFVEGECKLPAPGVQMRCGEVIVPESRQGAATRTIALGVQVVLAPSEGKQPDAVVILGGGPGEILTDKAAGVTKGPRDIVLLDQRGLGLSRPSLVCEDARPEERIEGFLTRAERDRRIAACAARHSLETDLSAYSTQENAADVIDVMRTLGYKNWNILGVSYGSRLALAVLRMKPKDVRSVILDSPYPPEVNGFDMQRAMFFDQLDVLLTDCAADRRCDQAFPNLKPRIVGVLSSLARNPAEAQVRSHRGGPKQKAKVGARLVLGDLRSAMYDPQALPLLPRALERLAEADLEGYFDVLDGPRGLTDEVRPARPGFFSFGMQLSIQCQDDQAWSRGRNPVRGNWPEEVVAEYGSGFDLEDCKVWRVRSATRASRVPVSSDVPVLVLAGQYDPVTPPELGSMLLPHLKNSRMIVIPGAGHALTRTTCGRKAMGEFLTNPSGALDGSCIAEATKSFQFQTAK